MPSAKVVAFPREASPAIKVFPTRRRSWRARLSRIRAQLQSIVGAGGGFFTQYRHVGRIQRVTTPYPEVERICAAAPFSELMAAMVACKPIFRRFGEHPTDPVFGRGMFPALDGMACYAAVRQFRPNRIVEIGSGDSTYFLARAVKDNGPGRITCIDPRPRRDVVALDVDLRPRLMTCADAEMAGSLEAGDILFIDSSHIMLPGMDVDIQFNRMFPRLKRGVIVHLHDIFLPDDYPPHWNDRNYSEQNALVGWIVSGYFDVLWPGRYVVTRRDAQVQASFGDCDLGPGTAGSFWLRKS